MRKYEFFIASSLEKVFADKRPQEFSGTLSVFRDTRASVQLIYIATAENDRGVPPLKYELSFKNAPVEPKLRKVELMPSDFPCWQDVDDNYITKSPGLFPDLLTPLDKPVITPLFGQYRSLFITFDIPSDCKAGLYDVELTIKPVEDELLPNGYTVSSSKMDGREFRLAFSIRVVDTELLSQKLIHTEWFHCDCLADYYNLDVFSEEHWHIIENFMRAAVDEHGINMILTPIFTPPLDTAFGGERPTVQLVDIKINGEKYSFDFAKLRRWLRLCKDCGVEYIEMSHLFTQWGAKHCPKIIAEKEDGSKFNLFGWHSSARSLEYRKFLEQLIPALQLELEKNGYDNEHVYYHISDEPHAGNLEDYLAAKNQLIDLLEGCNIIDALSEYEFYKQGIVEEPIVANDAIQPFIDDGTPNLWTYYCCAQSDKVPNRFFAVPSARNRIMGVLMYIYNIKGFLHWGYNFYYAQYSLKLIDPYRVSHANYAFPSGDPFLVYPSDNGKALSSIRAEVQYDALIDLRALQSLETLKGRDFVIDLIHSIMGELKFDSYPLDASKLLQLRENIADELNK